VDESLVFDPTDLSEDVTPAATLKALGQVRARLGGSSGGVHLPHMPGPVLMHAVCCMLQP
jgi:hypothetical protein